MSAEVMSRSTRLAGSSLQYGRRQQNPVRRYAGIGAVLLLHIFFIWALMSGLANKVVQIVQKPIETKIIEPVKPPPPPPMPTVQLPPPKFTPPPPPFVPPPEVPVTPPPVAPTITHQAVPVPTPVAPPASCARCAASACEADQPCSRRCVPELGRDSPLDGLSAGSAGQQHHGRCDDLFCR